MKKKYTVFVIILVILTAGVFTMTAMGRSDDAAAAPAAQPAEAADGKTAAVVSNLQDNYPPADWVTDISEAYRLAQEGNKNILLNFTGSDWCVWCKKLTNEVFSTPEFKSYADDNLVLLFLDFPNSIDLPAEQVQHNQFLAQVLGVTGYPTLWLLGSDFSPLLKTGYQSGGVEEYIRHLSEDRPDVEPKERENFKASFTEAIEANFGPLK